MLKLDRGEVLIDGQPARDRSVVDLALIVGTVLQNPDEQISEAIVKEEIAFPLAFYLNFLLYWEFRNNICKYYYGN